MVSMVGDVPVDSEVPVVTSSVSEDAYRGRVCLRAFIRMTFVSV